MMFDFFVLFLTLFGLFGTCHCCSKARGVGDSLGTQPPPSPAPSPLEPAALLERLEPLLAALPTESPEAVELQEEACDAWQILAEMGGLLEHG